VKTVCEHSQFETCFPRPLQITDPRPAASLRDKRLQIQHFATDRDEQVAKASKLLGPVSDSRLRRAEAASCQGRVQEVLGSLASLRKDNDKSTQLFYL
jgi:hypothetical protein